MNINGIMYAVRFSCLYGS